MRKGLAASAVLASVLLAGCSGGNAETPKGAGGDSSAMPTPTSEPGPQRTAPAKALELPDKCALVTEPQWRELGANQPPRETEVSAHAGCDYEQSEAEWNVFLATVPGETMQDFADEKGANAEVIDLAGYPAAQVGTNKMNCLLSVDIADQGSLFVSTLSRAGNPDPCELSKKFAKAAVQNLPNEGA